MGMKKCCTLQVKQTWSKTGLFYEIEHPQPAIRESRKIRLSFLGVFCKIGWGCAVGTLKPLLYTRLLHNKLF